MEIVGLLVAHHITLAREKTKEITIYANREGSSLNIFHNQMNKLSREPQ
jgi:hypothetical protein